MFQKVNEMLVVRMSFCDQRDVSVRHCYIRIFFKKMLAFNYADRLQNRRPFATRGVERELHVIV